MARTEEILFGLPKGEQEILIRPFDSGWEVIVKVYNDKDYRAANSDMRLALGDALQAAAEGRPSYIVIWDNGHSSGRLSQAFDNYADARAYAENWWNGMVKGDNDPKEAAEIYSYEVVNEKEIRNAR